MDKWTHTVLPKTAQDILKSASVDGDADKISRAAGYVKASWPEYFYSALESKVREAQYEKALAEKAARKKTKELMELVKGE